MLTLGSRGAAFEGFSTEQRRVLVRITTDPKPSRSQDAFLIRSQNIPSGFSLYIAVGRNEAYRAYVPSGARLVVLPKEYEYLKEGDLVRFEPMHSGVRVLFRKSSAFNNLLLTENCNNFCLMCSQPPKVIDDSWIVPEIHELIQLIDPSTPEIGLSGGEPTLLGEGLFGILEALRDRLPRTAVHILSNGRSFQDAAYAVRYSQVRHPDVMIGIPLYGDTAARHDYVVQAKNAFDETIRGILNLKRFGQRVEIRIVIHRQTFARLRELAEFIGRNLRFVDHVALMGLEITGFTRANLPELWIDPADYQNELEQAVEALRFAGVRTSIYNHQLCVLRESLHRYAKRSISDWKNEYFDECGPCEKKDACGGFFSSARIKRSDHIRPFVTDVAAC